MNQQNEVKNKMKHSIQRERKKNDFLIVSEYRARERKKMKKRDEGTNYVNFNKFSPFFYILFIIINAYTRFHNQ